MGMSRSSSHGECGITSDRCRGDLPIDYRGIPPTNTKALEKDPFLDVHIFRRFSAVRNYQKGFPEGIPFIPIHCCARPPTNTYAVRGAAPLSRWSAWRLTPSVSWRTRHPASKSFGCWICWLGFKASRNIPKYQLRSFQAGWKGLERFDFDHKRVLSWKSSQKGKLLYSQEGYCKIPRCWMMLGFVPSSWALDLEVLNSWT